MRKLIPIFVSFIFLIGCSSDKNNQEQISACGNVTDIDGNIYSSVTIGTQCWLQKNLNVSRYRNGDIIPEVTSVDDWVNLTTGAWCYYSNSTANGTVYGKLYNWYAVNDPRGLAPVGSHIATYSEWGLLKTFLGTGGGGKLKAMTLWDSPNDSATNSTGFTGLPGGCRTDHTGVFEHLNRFGCFWSSTEGSVNIDEAGCANLYYDAGFLDKFFSGKNWAYSVRCIKD